MSLEMNNDVNVSSLTNKNIIRWNGSNWVHVADLTNAETNVSTLQVSTGILVNTTNTSQNATIVTSFSDSSSGNPIIHGNATTPSIITPTAAYLYPTDDIMLIMVVIPMQILLIHHHIEDIILIMVHYINFILLIGIYQV